MWNSPNQNNAMSAYSPEDFAQKVLYLYMKVKKKPAKIKFFTGLGRFCYLNFPCVRINITLIFMSSSSEEFTH